MTTGSQLPLTVYVAAVLPLLETVKLKAYPAGPASYQLSGIPSGETLRQCTWAHSGWDGARVGRPVRLIARGEERRCP